MIGLHGYNVQLAMSRNLLNSECQIHKKICEYMCCYSKCAKRLICEKCRKEHLDIHPAQFIYELSNLAEIHSYNKVDKLKEILIKEKIAQELVIREIYMEFDTLIKPLQDKVKAFSTESKALIESELSNYLKSNKYIIDDTEKEIKKSDTKSLKSNPNKMLEETINETQIINRRETRLIENGQSYKWYSDTTKEMCVGVVLQIKSMMKVAIKLMNSSLELQKTKYSAENAKNEDHHEMSFFKRYHASHEVAIDRLKLENDVLQYKKNVQYKDGEINKNKKEIRDKVVKISELEEKIEGLSEELQAWEQKKEREEREKMIALEKERKMKEEMLIKNGIIGSNGKSLCFQRKEIDENLFPLILQLVPHPITLDISNHQLNQEQIELLMARSSIQVLKYNFTKLDENLLYKFLKSYSNLKHLELNSCEISDQSLFNISKYFTQRLKSLYIIDNHITDDGLEQMFNGSNLYLDQLYISYNRLTHKGIETLNKYAHELRVLHIAKNQIKQKGGSLIGRHMKLLQELFIGSTGMTKEGFLAICRNCIKLKRLSVVANEITTEVVTEILLGLKQLEWLDLSYCKLTKDDIEKIQKLKIFNKDLNIIFGI